MTLRLVGVILVYIKSPKHMFFKLKPAGQMWPFTEFYVAH